MFYKSIKNAQYLQFSYLFHSLFEIIQTLYWAAFGLIELDSLDLRKAAPEKNPEMMHHEFTEFVAKLMFGAYNCIASIVLINMLIAMMSNSYQNISVSILSVRLN